MLKSNRESNYWSRDHVNHNKFSKIALSTKFYEGLVSIYDVNCLLEGNVLARNQP